MNLKKVIIELKKDGKEMVKDELLDVFSVIVDFFVNVEVCNILYFCDVYFRGFIFICRGFSVSRRIY